MTKMRRIVLEPVADRVVIIRDELPAETPGGLVLPDKVTERPQTGVVIAVGPDKKQVKPTDRVVFSPYGETITIADQEYVVLHENDVIAIIR